ncbi:MULTISPECIES: ABC transporter ATP-binding protein [Photobacterium]|uniref:ABC transporter ATP-binding protein n=1 Tax=Photobacterium TaxID=657 RepID=UPI000D1682DA|nr:MULTISPECIES: ABC transporter ATP-binding protein [Photobacterium]MCD9516871.1 ATP-binding cassette domain-containing protein [Photobacterium carnosum]PSU81662.1 ABC transporter [Photobacterium phosphoreum]
MYKLNNILVTREQRDILNIGSLKIPTDKVTVILGHNGSGKSTLVNLLAGQTKPDSGSVELNGHPIHALNSRNLAKQVAYLPQHLPQAEGLSVRELVKLGRFPWLGTFGRMKPSDHEAIDLAMQATKVTQYAEHSAEKLSGGERQRAWVAMLLAQQSPLLILDEPTSALDVHHQYHLMELLCQLKREQGKGVIIILHDLNLTLRYAEHILALKQGKVVFSGSSSELMDSSRLSELYNTEIQLLDHPTQDSKVAVIC